MRHRPTVNKAPRGAPDIPLGFRLWEPAEVEVLEAGLPKAGVAIRASQYALKDSEPNKWRQYLIRRWGRHQHKPQVQKL